MLVVLFCCLCGVCVCVWWSMRVSLMCGSGGFGCVGLIFGWCVMLVSLHSVVGVLFWACLVLNGMDCCPAWSCPLFAFGSLFKVLFEYFAVW